MNKVKVSIKRKVILKCKEEISKCILYFLYKGFKVLYKYDNELKKELMGLPENFSVNIQIAPKGYRLCLSKKNEEVSKRKRNANPDMNICFNNIDVAFKTLIGLKGISKAYSEHAFTLKGNVNEGMKLVRCIDIIEAYLFPKFMAKRILKQIPKKTLNPIRTYMHVIFEY